MYRSKNCKYYQNINIRNTVLNIVHSCGCCTASTPVPKVRFKYSILGLITMTTLITRLFSIFLFVFCNWINLSNYLIRSDELVRSTECLSNVDLNWRFIFRGAATRVKQIRKNSANCIAWKVCYRSLKLPTNKFLDNTVRFRKKTKQSYRSYYSNELYKLKL